MTDSMPVSGRLNETANTHAVPRDSAGSDRIGDSAWPDGSIECLVDRYERPLLGYATRMLGGDHNAAQDAVQETFLRLCRTDRSKIESRVAAWLYSVCRTRVIDMQRTHKPTPAEVGDMAVADRQPTADQVASDGEDKTRLEELIDGLTQRQQEVLRLRLQGGLSYREIAETTGMTVSNVGFHLHQAVRSLRQAFASP